MIKILDSSLKRQAVLKDIIKPNRFEEINGQNTLTFSTIFMEGTDKRYTWDSADVTWDGAGFSWAANGRISHLDAGAVFELDNDYFDLAYYSKNQNQDGTLTIDVEAEHISYRLNDYKVDYFTKIGTPTEILADILTDTGFTVGAVEYVETMTYSAQEAKTKRQMIMELVALLGAEVVFNKFEVSVVVHRGNAAPRLLTAGKNITVVSKIYNKREQKEGNPLVAYTCEPIQLPGKLLGLGDEVLLVQKDLGIRERMRVVRVGYDPYSPLIAELELANFISGIEDQMYRIATTTVAKEKLYNGCRIGPDEGFVAERSDLKAKTILNATEGISIYSATGEDEALERNFYVDLDGRIKARAIDIDADGTFGGTLTADALEAVKANIDVVVSNTIITQNLYSSMGRIADLTVNELDTSYKKITNYLEEDTSPVYYKRDYEQYSLYIQADTDGLQSEQYKSKDGTPLYWTNADHEEMTTDITSLPVMVYKYEEHTKMELSFRDVNGDIRPRLILGAGFGNVAFPERGKFIIDKATDGGILSYTTADGTEYSIEIGENGIIQNGEEKLTALNFFANGFSADYNSTTVSYRWDKDVDGRITQLEDLYTGETVPVTWGGGSL